VPLVERQDLLARLRAERTSAEAGNGRVVLVTGEAGAGKTSLVRRAFPSGTWGYCEPLTTPRALGPFLDIAIQFWPQAAGARNGIALANRLLHQLRNAAPALVIEDAHWMDSSSAEVLRYLVRRIPDTAGIVVVTARDEGPADSALRLALADLTDSISRIEVPPLSRPEVEQVVRPAGLDVDTVLRLTGGNAFLVGQLVAEPTGQPGRTLTDSVAARLVRLTVRARALAELLSVIPGRTPVSLVGEDWPLLDELIVAGLVQLDATAVQFRHELVRLAVIETVSPGRRPSLHAEVLQRMTATGSGEVTRIAHHARQAHQLEVARAADIDAGLSASALGSHHEAVVHLRRAADDYARLPPHPAHVRLLLRLVEEERCVARDDVARATAQDALQVSSGLDDALLHSAVLRTLSQVEPDEQVGRELAQAALAVAEPFGESADLAAAFGTLATNRMLARDLAAAIGYAERATELAGRFGDARSEVSGCNAMGSALLLLGDPAGQPLLRRAIHLAAAQGLDAEVGRAYGNLVSATGEARLYELSASANREAARYFASRDLDAMAAYTGAWHARCLFEQGHWQQAEAELAGLSQLSRQLNANTELMQRYLTVRLNVRRGSGPVAQSLDRAQQLATATGSLQRVAPVAAARAEASWLASGRGDQAGLAELTETYQLATSRQSPWIIGELGYWLWRFDRLAELPAVAAEPFRLHVAGDYRSAAAAWTELGCPYEAADALSDSSAPAEVSRALQMFTDLGALPARQRAARRLRLLGVRSIPRGPRRSTASNPNGLTAREGEVRAWLLEGHTDAEIAAGLHLSVRTVEHHVAAVLRKLQLDSRRALRTAADGSYR
jgi:DNA-binding NarL/FixJ family response regulator